MHREQHMKGILQRWSAVGVGVLVRLLARLVTAARPVWQGIEPLPKQRIYYANHASHGDFVLIWMTLPPRMRAQTRPVAGADYWQTSTVRRFLIEDVFHAVLIDRRPEQRQDDPLEQMGKVLGGGDSLILFPEGTRNTGDTPLLPFKSGLYRLAKAHPQVELIPVWIDNLNRVLPKGEIVPIPLLCTVTYGAPLALEEGEDKTVFLARAERALLALSNSSDPSAREGTQ